MKQGSHLRILTFSALAFGCLAPGVGAQAPRSVLPPTGATAPSPLAAVSSLPPPRPPRAARITWSAGRLSIFAEDSSLNQILEQICRLTGMAITGGVTEERVYGTYGPDSPGPVLASLLAGTGSNMLLKENLSDRPLELVLTPRHGGPTPPGPSTYARNHASDDDLPPQQIVPTSRPGTLAARPADPSQSPASPVPTTDQPAPAASAADTTTQRSPNGVKTPQEIYDELMKLQQGQQKKPSATPQ